MSLALLQSLTETNGARERCLCVSKSRGSSQQASMVSCAETPREQNLDHWLPRPPGGFGNRGCRGKPGFGNPSSTRAGPRVGCTTLYAQGDKPSPPRSQPLPE